MNNRLTTTALLACGLALPAAAQDMKPGLWEMTNNASYSDGKVQASAGDIQKLLGSLTPEQRRHVQQMARQNGVQLDLGGDGALRSRMCLTREMIERKEVPMQEGDCSHRMTPAGADRLHVAFSCTRPRASGEGEMVIDNPTTYHAHIKVHNQDQPNQVADMEVAGRWLGADCGDVHPVTSAADKRRK